MFRTYSTVLCYSCSRKLIQSLTLKYYDRSPRPGLCPGSVHLLQEPDVHGGPTGRPLLPPPHYHLSSWMGSRLAELTLPWRGPLRCPVGWRAPEQARRQHHSSPKPEALGAVLGPLSQTRRGRRWGPAQSGGPAVRSGLGGLTWESTRPGGWPKTPLWAARGVLSAGIPRGNVLERAGRAELPPWGPHKSSDYWEPSSLPSF